MAKNGGGNFLEALILSCKQLIYNDKIQNEVLIGL